MKRIITLTMLFMSTMLLQSFAATQDADVKGKVVNQSNQPIVAASVYLMSTNGNALIKTAVTDENGNYSILKAPKGNYYIQVTSVGYQVGKSEAFDLLDKAFDVPTIQLAPNSQTIETVTVQGQVPTVQSKDGKLILNVENSTVAAGNNALDIVKRAPGVSVDKDDNLQLMGQQGVNVTIDGRQTFMTGEQLTTFLKSTDGAQIKSIEVSTTRSAKEDAAGSVGTINIVMKKSKLEGFNGSLLASGAKGEHYRANSTLSLNYKKNNTTLFGSYSYGYNKRQFDLNLFRTISNSGKETFFNQDAFIIEPEKNHNYRVGVEQKTSEKNTMLLQFTGNNNDEGGENLSASNVGPSLTVIDSVLKASSLSSNLFNRYSVNFNNEYLLDTLGSKLIFDVDWSTFKNSNDVNYIYNTVNAQGNNIRPEENERSRMPAGIDIYVAKLDFQKQIGLGKFETGVKYSNVKSDNDLNFEFKNASGNWENFTNRSNHFIYTEQVAAGYVDYNRTFGKWSTKAGVRAEYTISDGNSVTANKHVKKDYLDWFPSANVSYNASQNHFLSLSYAKKITRPNYRYLNPFRYYIDKLTYQEGNAYINPQYTHGLTLNYTLMQMFNFTLGTDITNDAMVESLGQDSVTNETWISRANLAKNTTSYININAPFRIGKIWSMNNNVTGIYMHFKGPIAGHMADLGSFFVQVNSAHTFKLTSQLSAELSLNGNTPFIYNVYKIHGRWNADAGLNYNFKDQRSALKFAVTDVFRTNKNIVSTNFHEFNSRFDQYNDNQTFRLTYTYKFGNLKQQFRKKESSNEERDRASQ